MTSEQRSLQIWALLVCAARERRVYTYMGIAQILGFGGAIPVIPALDNIMWFCRVRGLPPLTVLVANGKTGEPGDGLPLDDKSAGEQREMSSVSIGSASNRPKPCTSRKPGSTTLTSSLPSDGLGSHPYNSL